MSRRIGVALLALLAIMTLFAEGLLDHPWIPWLQQFGPSILSRPKLVILLLIPVAGYLLAGHVRWIREVLAVTAISSLTISTLDLTLRVFGVTVTPQIPSIRYPGLPALPRWAPNRSVRAMSYGDVAGLARDPSLRELRSIRFRTDGLGFRNDHEGTDIDLLVLGDSFGAGLGTDQDSMFASLLERGQQRRVYNLSYPSGPRHQYLNLLAELPRLTFRPGAMVLWVLFTGNDLSDVDTDFSDSLPVPWRKGSRAFRIRWQNYRARSPIRMAVLTKFSDLLGERRGEVPIRRLLPSGQSILFRASYQHDVSLSRDQAEHHQSFPKIERAMGLMRQLTAEHGLGLTMVIIPAKEEIYRWILEANERRVSDTEPSGFAQAILAACERTGIRCLDSKSVLTREASRRFDASGELVYWSDDSHLNNRGHRILADFIATSLWPEDSVGR